MFVDNPFLRADARLKRQYAKVSRTQVRKLQLLREEARGRAVEAAGVADPVRVELDPAEVGVEDRSAREDAIPNRCELVAGTVHVQLFPTDEPFGMSQDDGADHDASETELVGHEDLTSPTDGTATMAHAELGGDDQDVALLRLDDQIERV